jgi:hypothetical protein
MLGLEVGAVAAAAAAEDGETQHGYVSDFSPAKARLENVAQAEISGSESHELRYYLAA